MQRMDERAAACHWLLLRLAGAVPDEALVRCRTWLADGDLVSLARTVGHAVVAGGIPLRQQDLDLLRELAEPGLLDQDELALMEAVEFEPPSRVRFAATLEAALAASAEDSSGRVNYGGSLTPVVSEGPADPVEGDLIDAAAGEPGVLGVWRAWRYPVDGAPWPPPKRVFVVEAADDVRLAGIAVSIQRVLVEAGESDPLVEVYPAGFEVPGYTYVARGAGPMLWAREPDPGVRIAELYDEVDPVAGPRISPDHSRMDEPERGRVLRYLDAGEPLLVTSATMADVVDPKPHSPVPMSYRTDGLWIWNDAAAYYLRQHAVAPDLRLVAHIRTRAYAAESAGGVALHRAHAALMQMIMDDQIGAQSERDS